MQAWIAKRVGLKQISIGVDIIFISTQDPFIASYLNDNSNLSSPMLQALCFLNMSGLFEEEVLDTGKEKKAVR